MLDLGFAKSGSAIDPNLSDYVDYVDGLRELLAKYTRLRN